MTVRQRVLKWVYPLFSFFKRKTGAKKIQINSSDILPPVSFYNLHVILTNGTILSFEKLRGKKVLLVNTASDCGYTSQYDELQKLYENSSEFVEIIAFPSNDFKQQERGTDEEIAKFCSDNYNIGFFLAKKSPVKNVPGQNSVYQWLTHPSMNGWNDQLPSWNFSKYLVNEKGTLTHYFDPAVSPLSSDISKALRK